MKKLLCLFVFTVCLISISTGKNEVEKSNLIYFKAVSKEEAKFVKEDNTSWKIIKFDFSEFKEKE